MITYDYRCPQCEILQERSVPLHERDDQRCACGMLLVRQMSAPLIKIAGKVVSGGGPDRFTADMLGIPLKELPEGLKAK